MPSAEEDSAQLGKSQNPSADTQIAERLKYPWVTKAVGDSLVVGIRRQGRGYQACIERMEGNRLVRRLEPASDIGLLEVKQYIMGEHKNLAENQCQWSHKDRDDFKCLHWVTKAQGKLKNTAAGGRDPPADCCVEFTSKGLQILTVSSLCKVLGPISGRAQITEVCKKDDIDPPWKTRYIATYADPSAIKKDPAIRRSLRDKASRPSATDEDLRKGRL